MEKPGIKNLLHKHSCFEENVPQNLAKTNLKLIFLLQYYLVYHLNFKIIKYPLCNRTILLSLS